MKIPTDELEFETFRSAGPVGCMSPGRLTAKFFLSSLSGTRSCGRLGPASAGSIVRIEWRAGSLSEAVHAAA